jgi:hypothetical protein
MAVFEVVLVARAPQSATTPTLTIVNRLVTDTISYTDELNRPGSAALGCPIQAMGSDVKARLVDLEANPSEVWVYADGVLVWAGELQTLSVQGQSVSLGCVGLLGYSYRMGVISDLIYAAVDQFTIAKGLVDHHQAQTFGNYGIDTSTVGTSGVVRDRTYLRNELHNIGQRLSELGAVSDGFDIRVDAVTRKLVLTNPQSGTDLTATVVLDRLNIDSAVIAVSIAPDDVVSDVSATGTATSTGGVSTTLFSSRSAAGVRSVYGRSWAGQNFDGVSVQGTLDNSADAYLNARGTQLFQPGLTVVPRTFPDVASFHPGDTVSYSYDAGLGLQTLTPRVGKNTVDVDSAGKARMTVEFI